MATPKGSMWARTWKLENETAILRSQLYAIRRNRQAAQEYREAKRELAHQKLSYRIAAGIGRALFQFTVWLGLQIWNQIK